ncbi:MAG: delta-60 repeat domain-containing protein [Leptonema sp. (in: bacteria)]
MTSLLEYLSSENNGSGFVPAVGELDPTFGSGGIVTTNIGGSYDEARAIAIQPNDEKILVAGFSNAYGTDDFALVRYNSDGSLDTSFDTDGIVTTNIISGSYEGAYAIAIQPNGKILVTGFTGPVDNSNTDIFVIRYFQ